jgi:hypothetical protein
MKIKTTFVIVCIAAGLAPRGAAFAASDDFSSNPLAGGSPWTFGLGDNSHGQFSWSPGALTVHVDSSLPTARLDLPLGMALGDSTSFVLSARFSFHVTSAPDDQFAQFAFGLTNAAVSGGDRTGSLANFDSANTYHTIEFDYFPNVSQFFGGPTLSPAVFGGPDGSAFNNFASIFGPDSVLGDNTTGITELPQDTLLEARLNYDGPTKTLTMSMFAVGPGDVLSLLDTELVPLDIDAFGSSYDPFNPFVVDTLSIMAYHDGFTTAEDPSLAGDITFDRIGVTVAPEPSSLGLCSAGTIAFFGLWALRRGSRGDSLLPKGGQSHTAARTPQNWDSPRGVGNSI